MQTVRFLMFPPKILYNASHLFFGPSDYFFFVKRKYSVLASIFTHGILWQRLRFTEFEQFKHHIKRI